ncbi:hypothetical protein Cch01nite_06900 [Cellulomonas chitinilytica]|uniref:Helix-hairpin-helix DNA-binding motif class 1 domain-containing protein n=1 Tax=Cellulomonas chitinilytica TaxID=398759 RepID=A0A919P1K1_9CELL|nr:helix-hairpin-helix domain-containing protein [Cellulomonas chitinilytica]GIG19966.1 hypothetical protein Cch01nite_06900 [Cellulomonas chitinilytica]
MPRSDPTAAATLRRLGDLTAATRAVEPAHSGWTPAPTFPAPSFPAPTVPDLTVPAPTVPDLTVPAPAIPDLTVPVPTVPGPEWPPVPDPTSGPSPIAEPYPTSDPSLASERAADLLDAPASVRTERALEAARAGYVRAHGHPLDRVPHVPRRRVRWAVPWRLAGAAGVVLLVVAGGVALRATASAPGEPVALPTPVPDGATPDVDAPVATEGSAAVPTDASVSGAGAGEVAAPLVVVHVVGAVVAPGVVRLPVGSRVVDALAAAGGATADADLAALNLARVLVDGEQVVVPLPGEVVPAAATPSSAAAPGLVDLNSADAGALDELPGIGPVLAQRIVEHRDERRFTSVDELGDVPGIGPTLLERLRPLVRV